MSNYVTMLAPSGFTSGSFQAGQSRYIVQGGKVSASYGDVASLISLGFTFEDSLLQALAFTSASAQSTVPPLMARQGVNQRHNYYIGVLGDSQSANAIYTTGSSPDGLTNPAWFIPGALSNFFRGYGWLSWVGPLSMQRVRVVKSWARTTNGLLTPGVTPPGVPISRQITSMLSDPLYSKINRVALLVGTNDFSYSIEDTTAELVRQLARIDKPVDLLCPPPRPSTSSAGSGLQVWQWMIEWRSMLRRVAEASNGNVRFVDTYTAVNQPLASPDNFISGYSYDNLHTSNAAAYKFAQAYINSLIPPGLSSDLPFWPNNCSAATSGGSFLDQGFLNPLFGTASGGTGTGVIAGSLTVTNIGSGSHVGSVASCTIPGGVGNMQSLAITSNAVGDGVLLSGASSHAAGGVFASPGDTLYAQALVRVNGGGIYPRELNLRMVGFMNPNNYSVYSNSGNETPTYDIALPMGGDTTLLLRTPELVVPTGVAFSSLTHSMRIVFAGSGSCSIDIAHFELRRKARGSYNA